jgi:multiple sugar transport system permease protein
MLLLVIFPLLYSLTTSFFDYDLIAKSMKFIGLGNYITLITKDSRFQSDVALTVKLWIGCVAIEMFLGIGIAILLNSLSERSRGILVPIMVIPTLLSGIQTGFLFRLVYHELFGPLNHILRTIGIISKPILWLSDPKLVVPSIIFMDVWQWTPFITLVTLAGFVSVPRAFYEAAEVDGLSQWQKIRYVMLPPAKSFIIIAFLIRAMDAIKIFDIIYVSTQGGPALSTESLTYYIYNVGFSFFRMGYAAAISYLLLVVVIIGMNILFKFVKIE